MTQYAADVRADRFPEDQHCYHMLDGEFGKFEEMVKQYEQTS